jgi:hypothetical protein
LSLVGSGMTHEIYERNETWLGREERESFEWGQSGLRGFLLSQGYGATSGWGSSAEAP